MPDTFHKQLLALPASELMNRRYCHVKRGSTYRVLCLAKLRITEESMLKLEHDQRPGIDPMVDSHGWSELLDLQEMVIYQAEHDGTVHTRLRTEFLDGRFEEIPDGQ